MWKESNVSKKIFKNKTVKIRWDSMKFNKETREQKLYIWTFDQFLKNFCIDAKFSSYEEMIKSMKRFLRKLKRGRWSIDENDKKVIVQICDTGIEIVDMLEYLSLKK